MRQLRGEVDWRGKGFREEKISKRCGHAVVEVFEMSEVCCVLPLHNGVAVLNMSIHTYVSENNHIKKHVIVILNPHDVDQSKFIQLK